jgi:SOS-response transcriptional repressor LexA
MTKRAHGDVVKDFIESRISFGKAIKELRALSGETQEQVARGIDVSLTYYCMLENSRVTNPSLQIATRILNFYGIAFPFDKLKNNGVNAKEIPYFNKVIPLGYPKEIPEGEIDNWAVVAKKAPLDFVVIVNDDSMKGRDITENNRLACRKDLIPKNGDIVVARINKKGRYIVRTYLRHKNDAFLTAANKDYKVVSAKDVEIIGVAVANHHMFSSLQLK